MIKKYGTLDTERQAWANEIDEMLRSTPKSCHVLYQLLSSGASYRECRDNWLLWNENGGRFPTNANTLEMCIYTHGLIRGREIYDERRAKNSERTSKNTSFIHNKEKVQAAARAAVSAMRENDADYDKKRLPCFPEYYESRGLCHGEDARVAAKEFRIRNAPPTARKIDFTAVEWADRNKRIRDKKMGNFLNGKNKSSCRTSKASVKFFDELAEHLRLLSPLYGPGNEWWIRDGASGYYFLDFLIQESGIVVEYNGHKFHPKSPNDPYYGFRGLPTAQEKWKSDTMRRNTIKSAGYHLIEVWDDELPNVQELAKEINELHIGRIEILSAV